jgi:APA family basic amino acid/polyamine antiporter
MADKSQKIGLITTTSLVIGNMIGVGIFLLPAKLARYGSISILGWIFSAIGALILAKIFSNLSKMIVNKSGGPYTYARAGFGDFIGFLVAWGYWLCIWISNGAIALAIVGALSFFFPVLNEDPIYAVLIGLLFIWLFMWINSRGVKESGRVQVVTTVLKILPLAFVTLVGLFFFNFDNIPAFNVTGESNFAVFPIVATAAFFAFLGIESATVPAENVENPEVTIPRATMLGTIITTVIYILGTVVLFGILPSEVMQNSPAPFAEAAKLIAGDTGGYFVAAGAVISGLGVLNGWTLIVAQIPMATAKDNLFPRIFKKENKKGAPIMGLVIGSLLTSLMMLMNLSDGLVDQFNFITDIAVFTNLVPYLFVSAAYVLILIEKRTHIHSWVKTLVLGALGVVFSIWAIYGSGEVTVFYGFILLMLGLPFYILMQWHKRND